jgi:aminoglycoside 3-N-acetyltransferase
MLQNKDNYDFTYKMLQEIDFSSAFIHSYIVLGFAFERRLPVEKMLRAHYDTLKKLLDNRAIRMPTFNYDFTSTHEYNVQTSPSHVGVLSEFFRTDIAKWRSPVPVFSFAGDDEPPAMQIDSVIDPFDKNSFFQMLVDNNALIIGYGLRNLTISSTITHYCERISGNLFYRYDKLFPGIIKHHGQSYPVTLKYHVRPMNYHLGYDCERLETELINEGLLKVISRRRFEFRYIKARDLTNYLINKIKENPMYVLDSESRKWIEPKLQQLGRPFLLSDFE